ncbi:hypothetical protein HYU45_01025 [Candidatus Daviesbacteria bacterium]|nr:hypothetical protein [Candidatus Daviesbacteria bacterium]
MNIEMGDERPLDYNRRLWVGLQATPVTPGTYTRFSVRIGADGQEEVVLKRLDLREEIFDPTTPIYLELRPKPQRPEKSITNNTINPREWHSKQPPNLTTGLDRYYPEIFRLDQIQTDKHYLNHPEDRPKDLFVITAQELKEKGSSGFYLKINNYIDRCPVETLVSVTKNPRLGTITICRQGPNHKLLYSTYDLSRITDYGPLSKKDTPTDRV